MRAVLAYILWFFITGALKLRYRIRLKGGQALPADLKGALFLPNHPSETDSLIFMALFWRKFHPRPLAVDYLFELPLIKTALKLVGALAMGNFDRAGNTLSRKRAEGIMQKIVERLRQQDNVLLYPAGRLQLTGKSQIGASSAVERILQQMPDIPIVLVRIKGLWGSSFSRAATGKVPPLLPAFLQAAKWLVLNGIFFMPRRRVDVEVEMAGSDFPRGKDRLSINQYIENWHNAGFENGEEKPVFVPKLFYKKEEKNQVHQALQLSQVDVGKVPKDLQDEVINEIARLCKRDPSTLTPSMELARELGMDSLDTSELVVFLSQYYADSAVSPESLVTVGDVMAAAAGMKSSFTQEDFIEDKGWEKPCQRMFEALAPGKTLPEVFLRVCEMKARSHACVDDSLGMMSYKRMRFAALLLSHKIARLPGKHIGILLPSTAAAPILILAVLLAKKVPVMLNWTMGSHGFLQTIETAGVKKILSSWKFLDRIQTVDLTLVEDRLVCMEDLRASFTLLDYARACFLSQRRAEHLLRLYNEKEIKEEEEAVILFTSGTEGAAKGVPLTHSNILSNMRAAIRTGRLKSDDVMLAFLPPFHSFGFTITTLLPLLSGIKVIYSPDPTDNKRLVRAIQRWRATVVCGSPTFVRNILHSGDAQKLRSVRLFVLGAESAPASLLSDLQKMGKEVLEGYGATECSPIITMNRPGAPLSGVGQPLPEVELLILDLAQQRILAKEQTGLILVHGPNVFPGYLGKDPNLGFVSMEGKRWYNTGDLGFIDEEGNLHLRGRLKRFVKIGGEMVNLANLENILREKACHYGFVSQEMAPFCLAVISVEKEESRPQLVLFSTCSITLSQANTWLREKGLSNIARLHEAKNIAQIPLLGTGKIDYRALSNYLN